MSVPHKSFDPGVSCPLDGVRVIDISRLVSGNMISLQLADGRTVASGRSHGDSEPTRPILRPRGGGGTSHYQHSRWWAWPLPPSGPLEFICHWPTLFALIAAFRCLAGLASPL